MMSLLINIDVDDLERGIGFYTAAFGLVVGRRFDPHGVELLGATSPIYLLAKPAGSIPHPGASSARDYHRHWTPLHLDFVVPEIEEALRRAVAAGAKLEAPIQDPAWGRLATLADPFGHGLCLVEFKGRGYDAIATAPRPDRS